jgi:UDP-GlcNAc3NAcA epimerase
MKRFKILAIVGARPQFIKHAAISRALAQKCTSLSIHTGQHYDERMSEIFFTELGLPRPTYHLRIGDATRHGTQTARMLEQIEGVLVEERPDGILVYGDTNSTLAGALAAAKLNMPVIHVEAGLRSFNRSMPEEINRVMTDHVSTLLFAPTQTAVENLRSEGITTGVFRTGDVMCDTLLLMRPYLARKHDGDYFFCTLHRPYNTDTRERLLRILATLDRLPGPVVFPVHPRAVGNLRRWEVDTARFGNIRFMAPLGYEDCLSYQSHARCVITDSGGIQKEAYMLGVPCITVRSETEWVETLQDGCNTLVFDAVEDIPALVNENRHARFRDIFGDGHAAETIADIIVGHFAG